MYFCIDTHNSGVIRKNILEELKRKFVSRFYGYSPNIPTAPMNIHSRRFWNVIRSMKTIRKVKIRNSKMKFPLISM
jgi:hypothetical protein